MKVKPPRTRTHGITRGLAESAGLASLGVGLWWLSPAWCLVIVGGLVLGLSLVGRMRT